MKLSRDELKDISAGASATEYGLLLTQFIAKVIAFITNLLKSLSDGGNTVDGGGGNDVINP